MKLHCNKIQRYQGNEKSVIWRQQFAASDSQNHKLKIAFILLKCKEQLSRPLQKFISGMTIIQTIQKFISGMTITQTTSKVY